VLGLVDTLRDLVIIEGTQGVDMEAAFAKVSADKSGYISVTHIDTLRDLVIIDGTQGVDMEAAFAKVSADRSGYMSVTHI